MVPLVKGLYFYCLLKFYYLDRIVGTLWLLGCHRLRVRAPYAILLLENKLKSTLINKTFQIALAFERYIRY
jgi:hypothetical protein